SAEAGYEGPPGDPVQGSLKIVGGISSPTAKALAALLGLPGRTEDQEPARLDLRVAGEPAGALGAQISLDALGAKARFDGNVTVEFPGLALSADGRVDLRAGAGDRVLAALGIPNPRPGGSLVFETRARTAGHRLDLDEFRATIDDLTYDGRVSLNDGRIDVAARAGELSLPWLVRLALLPNDGRPIDEVTLFAPEALGGLEGKITVDAARLNLLPGIDVRDGKTELSLADGTTRLAVAGVGPAGAPFTFDAETARRNDELQLDMSFEGGLELGSYLRAADDGAAVLSGPVAASGRITGHGRSPAGLALTLAGQGSVRLLDASLSGFDGRRFAAGIGAAKSASEVDRVLDGSFGAGELAFQAGEGSFRLAQGEAVLGPVPVTAGDLTGTLTTVLDITTGQYDVGLGLDLADETGLPPVEIAYTGPRDGLVRNLDASSLKSELSARALKESLEKLEQLQREQQAMFDERDQQVIEDARRNAEIQGRRQLQEYARRLDKEMQAINADEMSRRRREIRAWDAIAARLRADAKLRQAKPEIIPVEKQSNVPSPPPSGPAPSVISAPPAPSPNIITLPESVTLPETPPAAAPSQLAAPSASPEPASSAPPVESTNSIADIPATAAEAPAILAPSDDIGIPSQTGSLDSRGPVDLSAPVSGSLLLPPGPTPPPTVSENTPAAAPTFFERLLKPPSMPQRGKPAINGRNR
ncbi:MAG TPA: AsmA-like C-terminal region-containing protein, partial [Aestuariivirgaceae bacterium]|nr:AsmA-like C-terminal region-containing protein [Aestuariivirgaceae bacterium]